MQRLIDQKFEGEWVDWVRRIALGDEKALASLYDSSNRLVYGLALRILGDAGAAEEVTLDVYLQVWRQANRFDASRGRAATWLLVMARSRALDKLRAGWQERNQNEPLEAVAETRSETPDPEELVSIAQQGAQVRFTLNMLSDEQRQPIELAYFGGMSQSEIAAKLNQPLGTIKTRIRNGMLKLRQTLQSHEREWRSNPMRRHLQT